MSGLRLNLGSGTTPIPGFVNVDALEDAPGVDVVADIGERLPFDDGAAELVYASHLLEHFATDRVPDLLAEWRRVLRPGGVLLIAVPDLEAIASVLISREDWFTPPHDPWIGAIYGGQKDEYDFHKTGFTGPWLAHLMREAGFGQIERVTRFEEIPGRRCVLLAAAVWGQHLPEHARDRRWRGPSRGDDGDRRLGPHFRLGSIAS